MIELDIVNLLVIGAFLAGTLHGYAANTGKKWWPLTFIVPAIAFALMITSFWPRNIVTIATGGIFQQILPAKPHQSITIQNINERSNCWLHFGSDDPTRMSSVSLAGGMIYNQNQNINQHMRSSVEIQATCERDGDRLYVKD